MSEAHVPLSTEALEDPRPAVPHEEVRAEMLLKPEELRQRLQEVG